MRKIMIFFLLSTVLFSLCCCKGTLPKEQDAISEQMQFDSASNQAEGSGGNQAEDLPTVPTQTVSYHKGDKLGHLPIRYSENVSYISPPTTYSTLIDAVGTDGLIVAGYADGLRECYSPEGYTLTDFVVQSVYYGTVEESQTIKICEGYIIKTENDVSYIYQSGSGNTYLKDNQLVLLFLAKENAVENAYYPVFYEIFLPSDYQEFSEDYQTDFFDYFRGVRAMYQYPQQIFVEKNEGTEEAPNVVTIAYGGNYWPEQALSDAEMAAQLSEQILVQIVMDFRIKIWPSGHKQYYANQLPQETDGMRLISYPQDSL